MDWSGVDYCDVFISCLDSRSDGTHSLQRIHCWASESMLHFSKSDEETNSYLWWPEGEHTFSKWMVNYSFNTRPSVNKFSSGFSSVVNLCAYPPGSSVYILRAAESVDWPPADRPPYLSNPSRTNKQAAEHRVRPQSTTHSRSPEGTGPLYLHHASFLMRCCSHHRFRDGPFCDYNQQGLHWNISWYSEI